MIFVIFAILGIIGMILTYQWWKKSGFVTKKYGSDRGDAFTACLVTTIVAVVLGLLLNGICYFNQIDSIESIERDKKVVTIYKKKADVLTKQFVKYLMNYSEFEKDIYTKISPKDIDIYMVKYPELKASTTVIALVDNIYKLQDDVYNTEIAIEQYKKDIRARLRNPFVVASLLPSE